MLPTVSSQMPTDLRQTTRPAHTFDVDSPAPRQRKGITRFTVDIPSSQVDPSHSRAPRPPPRWRTPEFIFYAVMFALVVPLLVWVPISLSQRMFLHLLSVTLLSYRRNSSQLSNIRVQAHRGLAIWTGSCESPMPSCAGQSETKRHSAVRLA